MAGWITALLLAPLAALHAAETPPPIQLAADGEILFLRSGIRAATMRVICMRTSATIVATRITGCMVLMKRDGVLPADFDPRKPTPVNAYERDQKYWQQFRVTPVNPNEGNK